MSLLPPACAEPVVLLVFNRPEATERVLERVRNARPPALLVVADGPRADHPSDAEACARVRAVIEKGVDWETRLQTNFASRNMGLRERVSTGLTWAFEQVSRAIILEDDCVPHSSFFPFCSELLARYEDDPRVGVITGDNFQAQPFECGASYYFSKFPHCWGWASWRRAWNCYDREMKAWPDLKSSGWLDGLFPDAGHQRYWAGIFDAVLSRSVDSWAYGWTYSCWRHSLLTIIPRVNLVSNIGFGPGSTHTSWLESPYANMPVTEMGFPLVHPARISLDAMADEYTQKTVFGSVPSVPPAPPVPPVPPVPPTPEPAQPTRSRWHPWSWFRRT